MVVHVYYWDWWQFYLGPFSSFILSTIVGILAWAPRCTCEFLWHCTLQSLLECSSNKPRDMKRESWDDKMLRLVSHLGLMGTRALTTGCLVTSTSCFMLQYWCFSKALNNRSITSFLSMLVYWAPTCLFSSRCSRNTSRQNQDHVFPLFSLQLVQRLLLMSILERFFTWYGCLDTGL